MNSIGFVNYGFIKNDKEMDAPGAAHIENQRSESPCPDLDVSPEENESHVEAGQTWDDAARSWGQMVNREWSWESARRRYGEVVMNAVKEKVEAIQNLPSEIGGCCCGALRKPEKDSLVDPEIHVSEIDDQDGDCF